MAEITESYLGGTIGAGSVKSGTGLVFGVYQLASFSNGDFADLADFTAIRSATFTATGGSGATTAGVYIDSTTANRLYCFSSEAAVTTANILVVGTQG